MKNDIKNIFRNMRRLSGEDVVCFVLTMVPMAMIFLGLYPKPQKKKEGLGKLLRG